MSWPTVPSETRVLLPFPSSTSTTVAAVTQDGCHCQCTMHGRDRGRKEPERADGIVMHPKFSQNHSMYHSTHVTHIYWAADLSTGDGTVTRAEKSPCPHGAYVPGDLKQLRFSECCLWPRPGFLFCAVGALGHVIPLLWHLSCTPQNVQQVSWSPPSSCG